MGYLLWLELYIQALSIESTYMVLIYIYITYVKRNSRTPCFSFKNTWLEDGGVNLKIFKNFSRWRKLRYVFLDIWGRNVCIIITINYITKVTMFACYTLETHANGDKYVWNMIRWFWYWSVNCLKLPKIETMTHEVN